jgi:MYXO-CTERM domain-containing protein
MKQWLVRRGLLATVPVAALVFAFGACSSELGGPSTEEKGVDSGVSETSGEEVLAPSPLAQQRLARLGEQFQVVVKAPKDGLKQTLPAAALSAPRAQAPALPEPRPVVGSGSAERFLLHGDRVRADVHARLKKALPRPATVDLPRHADGFVRVQPDSSSIGIEFATKGAKPGVALEAADGVAHYPSAAPGGGDLVLRVTGDAVEDFVVLNTKPEQAFVDYVVNVSDVAGLRLYDNTLEFLATDGDPQIRVRPPMVIDRDATSHHAKLELRDCAADASALPPWDRPVTAPGKSQCTVRVSWDDSRVAYPAIVDPVWTTAGSLATARYRNAAVRQNSNGFVLTCGGIDGNGDILTSCEVFNPGAAGGLGSWAAAPTMTMTKRRSQFTMIAIGNDVLAVGGASTAPEPQAGDPPDPDPTPVAYRSELLSGGVWTQTGSNFSGGSFNIPRLMPVLTSDNAWVVIIDNAGVAYRYNVATKAWTMGASNGVYRNEFITLAVPGQGSVMRCGGYSNSSALKTCEKYTPGTNTWVMPGAGGAIADMNAARGDPATIGLDTNRLMLFAGYNFISNTYISTAEIYNATTNTWTNVSGSIPNNFYEYSHHNTWAPHGGSGRFLTVATQPMVFDPVASTWTQLYTHCEMVNGNQVCYYPMQGEGAIAPAGQKVLIVPVSTTGSYSPQTACLLFDVGSKGDKCNAVAECKTGLFCAKDSQWDQGYCCDTACTAPCDACFSGNKQSQADSGTCGPRSTNYYVGNTVCPYTDPSTCGTSGNYCDGAGACAKWPNTQACGSSSCLDSDTQNDVRYCDGAGTCQAQTTSDCGAGYKCLDAYTTCINYCNDDSYCTSSYYCQFFASPYSTCQPKKANGATCSGNTNSECSSGHCVDGVCCDLACDGTCEACTSALTGKTTGTCKPVLTSAGAQKNDCYDAGAGSCGQNGLCAGTTAACQLYANGTQCADVGSCASETSRYIPDTCNGTGTCVDKGTQACTTGYSCQAGVCNTQCTSDANCASAYWCDTVNKVCVADKTSGQACVRDAACAGNVNCVDGVCCDSPCTGTCRSCLKNQTGLAADGTCGDILDDTDPANECAKDVGYPASCEAPGLCDGTGSCRVYAKNGVSAKADTCSGVTLSVYTCDGAGNLDTLETGCYPYKCNPGGTGCRVACTEGTAAQDCDGDSFCLSGVCVGQKANGTACNADTECKSGVCANKGVGYLQGDVIPDDGAGGAGEEPDHPGVCCDVECGETCEACKASLRGQGEDGKCGPVKEDFDAKGDCTYDPDKPCGESGTCDGAGVCRKIPAGTSCGSSECFGNTVRGKVCNNGTCTNDSAVPCAPYVCRDVNGAEQCTSPCVGDDDCQDGFYCIEQACKKKLANGATCDSSGICASGFCVDGVCCDTSCNGQCAACDNAGSEGICSAAKGEPHGSRTKCDFAGEECGGSCDGVNASSCKYVATGTACGETTCDNGIAKSSECNGQGECRANKNTECSPYVCGADDTCLERCEQDADCSQGYACDEGTQRCLPAVVSAECSEDRQSSVGQNGIITPCKPFLCVPASGTCAVSCAFTTDCAPEFVCEASTKTCLPAPADAGGTDDESCACRAAGAAPTRHGYLAVAAFGLALAGLRRRKRSRHAPVRAAKPSGFGAGPHPFE